MARREVRRGHPHDQAGGRPRARRGDHVAGRIAQYLRALQKAAPTRTRLVEYAQTWEGRPLWLFVVGSAERMAKLDQVKADLQAPGRSARPAAGRRRSPRRASCRWWCGWCTACTATRSRRRRRAARGVSPAGRAGRRRRRRGAARRARADRPDAEPRRPRAVRLPEPAGPGRRRPMPRRTTPSTTSRGRAAGRTTTCST